MRRRGPEADLAVANQCVQSMDSRLRCTLQPVEKSAREFTRPLHPAGLGPIGSPLTEVKGLFEIAIVQFPDHRLRMRVAEVNVRVEQHEQLFDQHNRLFACGAEGRKQSVKNAPAESSFSLRRDYQAHPCPTLHVYGNAPSRS